MNRLLNFIIIALLVIEPPLLSQAQNVIIPPVLKGGLQSVPLPPKLQEMINSYLAKVVASHSEVDKPPTITEKEANYQYLNTQRIMVVTKDGPRTINPAKLQLEVAPPFIHNPFTELDYALTPEGDIAIRHKATGLYHIIGDINASSVSIDNHFIYTVTKSGEILGTSMKYLKGLLLQSPVPVFRLGEIPDDQKLADGAYTVMIATERTVPKLMTPYLKEKLRPPPGQKMYIDKGDLLIYDKRGVAIEIFRQSEMMTNVLPQSTATSLIGLITDPAYYSSENEIRKILDEYQGDLKLLKREISDPKFQKALSLEETSDTIRDLSNKPVREGRERIEMLYNFYKKGSQRKQLVIERYLKATEADLKEAEATEADEEEITVENTELDVVAKTYREKLIERGKEMAATTQAKLDQYMTPKNMIRIAGVFAALGGAATLNHYTGNVASLWAASLVAQMWAHSPEVLRGSLRWPTIHATGVVMLALPVINMVAWLGSIHTGWDFKRTMLVAGLRAYGVLVGIFYVSAQALRQHNVFPAIRAGLNPFDYHEMFNSPFAKDETILRKRASLEAKYRNEHRTRAFWWWVAHAHILKKRHLDPRALMAYEIELAEKRRRGETTPTDNAKQLNDWADLAQELDEFSKGNPDINFQGELRNMPLEKITFYLTQAENVENIIQSRTENENRLKEIQSRLKNTWKNTVPEVVGAAGFESFQAIMNLKPTHTISDQFYRKVKWYTIIGDVVDAIYGDRANPLNVDDLVSSKTGFLGVNPSYWLQQADTTLGENLIVMPAELTLTLDEGKREKLYLPELPSKNPMIQESLPKTAGRFLLTFLNLKKLNMGYFNKLRIVTTALTFPAVFLPGFTFRILAHAFLGAPQSYFDAIPAQIYTIFMSMWIYGWIDLASDRALTLTQQNVTAEYLAFRDIQVRLEQALNRNDVKAVEEAYGLLAHEYLRRNKDSDLPGNAADLLVQARQLLETSYQNPAAPQLPNEKLMSLITAVTVIGITMISIPFEVRAYGADPHWWLTALKALVYTGTFVSIGSFVQKKINTLSIWDRFDQASNDDLGPPRDDEGNIIHPRKKKTFNEWCSQLMGGV